MKLPKSSGLFYSLLISFAHVGSGLQKNFSFFSPFFLIKSLALLQEKNSLMDQVYSSSSVFVWVYKRMCACECVVVSVSVCGGECVCDGWVCVCVMGECVYDGWVCVWWVCVWWVECVCVMVDYVCDGLHVYVMSMCVCDGWVWVWWVCVCHGWVCVMRCMYMLDGCVW